jgi:cell division protein ZapA (FtsZ GTPase activity inhibitor)
VKQPFIEVTLGRIRMKVPIIVDEACTLRAVEQVNARLDEIEKQSNRVDSLEFALLAALSFAAEIEESRQSLELERERLAASSNDDTREFFAELDKIADALERDARPKGPRLIK